MNIPNPPAISGSREDSGLGGYVVNRLGVESSHHPKSGRYPGDIPILLDVAAGLLARDLARKSDIVGKMLALILSPRLDHSSFDDERIGQEEGHHIFAVTFGQRLMEGVHGRGDCSRIWRRRFAPADSSREQEWGEDKQSKIGSVHDGFCREDALGI